MSNYSRPSLEVADVFRLSGAQYKKSQQGHLSLAQLKVMSAIERCRSAQLGAHHLHCETDAIAYNSCRNRHCPKCQGSSAKRWYAGRAQQLLPVDYYHVVFTLPAEVAQLAFYNKALMYQLLFKAASRTLLTIAGDNRHLGAEIGTTMVLHTWGSAMTHHPHVHCIVPGGGLDNAKQWKACKKGFFLPVRVLSRLFRRLYMQGTRCRFYNKALMYQLLFKAASRTLLTIAGDNRHLGAEIGTTMVLHTWGSAMTHHPHVHCIVPGGGLDNAKQWKACKKGFFLPVRVLSRLFRRLYMQGVRKLYASGQLLCFGKLARAIGFEHAAHFTTWCKQQQSMEWVVYAKPPFAGPQAVLKYLSRYTHRVAIANRRLQAVDETHVTFQYKDYRRKGNNMHRSMELTCDEFMRRFLLHVLPTGFHRIRHYGLLASKAKLNIARQALNVAEPQEAKETGDDKKTDSTPFVCRLCQSPMMISALRLPAYLARAPPQSK